MGALKIHFALNVIIASNDDGLQVLKDNIQLILKYTAFITSILKLFKNVWRDKAAYILKYIG